MTFGVAHAQLQNITGTVSSGGEPLPGASVVVKGTKVGVTADFDGNYTIVAKPGDILVFTYIGFVKKEVTVGTSKKMNVSLSEDVAKLDEIVVIGYGSVRRKDLTGAVVSLKTEDLDKVKPVSFEGTLAAKASGVQVVSSEGGPGAGSKIRIRGGTSINASSDPLYVIDGFAIEGTAQGTGLGIGNSSTSPLANIDPSNIQSIEILKDASATAIYGSRGANGVILITTKRGKKGRANLSFETFTSFSTISNKLDLLTAQEFVDYRLEYTPWDPNVEGNQFMGAYRDQYGNPIDLNDPRVILTDWQDEITRTAITTNYKIGLSGGTDKTSYSASFSYLNQEGIIKTTDYERYSANFRVDQNISDKLKTGISLNVGYNQSGGIVSAATENGNGRSGVITQAVLFSPAQGLTQYDDAVYDENGRIVSLRNGDVSNPNLILENDINKRIGYNIYSNAYIQYKLTDDLIFKSSIRLNMFGNKGKRYFSEKFGWGQSANGRAFVGTGLGKGITVEQNLNWRKSFGVHTFNVTAVYEQQQGSYENLITASTGFNLPNINIDNLGTAEVTLPSRSDYSDSVLKSYLARIQYDFSDKWTLNVSGRYDGSSRFAEGGRWGFFPSAGIAWKTSNEDFLKGNNVISNLKLKASYGETGNASIGSYRSLARASLASAIFNGSSLTTGVAINQLSNPDLTWETTSQLDAGISLGLFDSKIAMEIDYYEKETTDLLLARPLPTTSGFETSFQNIGSMTNKGFEFSLNTVNIETEDFSWTSNFNISFNKNEITNLGDADEFFVTATGSNQITNDYVVRVGESLGSIFGIEVDGVYNYSDFAAFDGLSNAEAAAKMRQDAADQNLPYYDLTYTLKDGTVTSSGVGNLDNYRPGMPKFVDQNGDGNVDAEDRTIIGRTAPKHFGGLTNNFKYKQFDLTVIAQWSYGNDVYNKNRDKGEATAIPYFNKYGTQADRWTPENPDTDVAGIWGYGDAGIGGNTYSHFIEDGSYLRIANITLGYNLPKKTTEKMGIKSIRFYGAVDNAFLFTKYTGFDPDVSVGNNQLTPGLDSDSYPRARTFRLGLNVGF
ncbi:SusC/RagA family TonB-linked outer membrane protein [Polaribacter reichenbachii]|nr:TonB-dependent receptor [Polaribacter reichenbachii]APZ45494.1 SusC/RagA family TonB-linked outer membrane protein [Polaribacter reichenbachii]AUC19355.1 SusC/RagA family TonB-linked outer membrane protein [Polaribacter reichenbachii]